MLRGGALQDFFTRKEVDASQVAATSGENVSQAGDTLHEICGRIIVAKMYVVICSHLLMFCTIHVPV